MWKKLITWLNLTIHQKLGLTVLHPYCLNRILEFWINIISTWFLNRRRNISRENTVRFVFAWSCMIMYLWIIFKRVEIWPHSLHHMLVVRGFCWHHLFEMHSSHHFGWSHHLWFIIFKRMFRYYFWNMFIIAFYWLFIKYHFVYLPRIRIVEVYFFLAHFSFFKHVIFYLVWFQILTLWDNIVLSLQLFNILLFILIKLFCWC